MDPAALDQRSSGRERGVHQPGRHGGSDSVGRDSAREGRTLHRALVLRSVSSILSLLRGEAAQCQRGSGAEDSSNHPLSQLTCVPNECSGLVPMKKDNSPVLRASSGAAPASLAPSIRLAHSAPRPVAVRPGHNRSCRLWTSRASVRNGAEALQLQRSSVKLCTAVALRVPVWCSPAV